MRRPLALLLLALPLMAAGPARQHPQATHQHVAHQHAAHHGRTQASRGAAAHRPLAASPAPAADGRYAAAPMPDPDITAPPERDERRTHVAPTLFHLNNSYTGDGYVYGSSPQGMDDRRAATIPGLKLTTPLP